MRTRQSETTAQTVRGRSLKRAGDIKKHLLAGR